MDQLQNLKQALSYARTFTDVNRNEHNQCPSTVQTLKVAYALAFLGIDLRELNEHVGGDLFVEVAPYDGFEYRFTRSYDPDQFLDQVKKLLKKKGGGS